MIINVWKPIYNKSIVFQYSKVEKEVLLQKKGITACKVIWLCDNPNCKTPTKLHSINAGHLVKEKMSYHTQICRPCQCSNEGNGRYGDHRKWSDFLDDDKLKKIKKHFSEKWKGDKNPSKKDYVKIKKGQPIINEDYIKKIIESKNFELVELLKLNGKKSEFITKCSNGHVSKKIYMNFRKNNSKFVCEKCFYESISLHLSDEEIEKFEKFSKCARALTAKTYKLNKEFINPINLKISKNKYHLDHKYSISEGYKNNVSPLILSAKENLQIITAQENLRKQTRCSVQLDELIELTKYLSIKEK
jgi:hypothetical protein